MVKPNKKPQVCIVDDNRISRKILGEHLSSERYELHFSQSGKEFLASLDSLKPDVVLLDVIMPGMNGFEVCQNLKQQPGWQHIPVILVTTLDSKDALILGLEVGADEFLSKPVNGYELRSRVRSMLRIKKLYDELQATLELRKELADMIASDMKSSLNVITIHNELMLYRHRHEPQTLASTRAVQTQLRYLDSFVDELLLSTKMDEGDVILNRARVDVKEQVQRVIQNYREPARSKEIDFIVDLPEDSHLILLDTSLFDGMLDNLISYALKVSPAASTVTLRMDYPGRQNGTEPDTPAVRLQVSDAGPGIPQAEWNSISSRFTLVALKQENVSRIDPSLIFCKLAVKAHGGQMQIANNKPRGNVFTVEI